MIKGEAFSSSFDDLCSGSFSESESSNGHLGGLELSDIVGDGGNNNSDLVSISIKVNKYGTKKFVRTVL